MKMKHRMRYLVGALAIVVLAAFSGLAQEDIKTVNDSAFKEHIRPAVPFEHDKHNEKAKIDECQTCHHVYKDGKKVANSSSEDKKCSECHSANAKDSMSLLKVYHDRCKGCHIQKKTGPITCAECHPKM